MNTSIKELTQWVKHHPQLTIITIGMILLGVLLWVIFPHRSCFKELKDKGFADQDENSVFALKLIRSVILFKYNRAKIRKDFEENLTWFSQTYGEFYLAVSEIRWVRYFGFRSWMRLLPLNFPQKLTVNSSETKDSIRFGINAFNEYVFVNLKEIGPILATGRSGSGKSVFAKIVINHFRAWNMKSVIATPKPFDFSGYEVIDTEISLHQLETRLTEVVSIVNERKELMLQHRKTHANELAENNDYILVVIDEAYLILGTTKDSQKLKIQQMVNFLCRSGRAYGVVTLLVTQKLTKGELGEINLRDGYVLSGRQDTAEASIAAFGSDIATSDYLKEGVMIYRKFEKPEVVKVALWTK